MFFQIASVSRHEPVRWKYHAIGNYYLNNVKPPRHAWI